MNTYSIPRSFIVTLATLTLALALAAMPKGPAFADDMAKATASVASPQLDQRVGVEASQTQSVSSKGLIQSLNDLLGVKPKVQAKG